MRKSLKKEVAMQAECIRKTYVWGKAMGFTSKGVNLLPVAARAVAARCGVSYRRAKWALQGAL